MNRELKFRVWDNQLKNWNSEQEEGIYGWDTEGITLNGLIQYIQSTKIGEFGGKENRFVIQQFTGLKGKNGKDIYEGDILNVNPKWVAYKDKNKLVSFDEGQFLLDNLRLSEYCYGYEIVGNIFENSQLLIK